jgi:SAM-dependent methyltransferase
LTSRSALERWRETLEARAIPQAIIDAAPASPWGFPQDLFRRRAERAIARVAPTSERALEALPSGGTVLDVGCGGGATSIRLAERASEVTGVDGSPEMLATFREAIDGAGTSAATVEGAWPDVASDVDTADVVVCGHVLYNVQHLAPFVEALTRHARRRVVVEITDRHPLAWMNDLWHRFHGVTFPEGPSADDAVAALEESGIDVRRDDHVDDHAGAAGFETPADAVAIVRTRLCLPPERDAEVADALGDRLREHDGAWSAGPPTQPLATLWWSGSG